MVQRLRRMAQLVLKPTMSSASLVLLVACAGDKNAATGTAPATLQQTTGTPSGGGSGGTPPTGHSTGSGTGTGTGSTSTTTIICAQAASTPSSLDALQTPLDGMATFCHMDPTGLVLMTTTTVQCLDHFLNHAQDILPTTICDT